MQRRAIPLAGAEFEPYEFAVRISELAQLHVAEARQYIEQRALSRRLLRKVDTPAMRSGAGSKSGHTEISTVTSDANERLNRAGWHRW